jgi:hypothetical protein
MQGVRFYNWLLTQESLSGHKIRLLSCFRLYDGINEMGVVIFALEISSSASKGWIYFISQMME